CNHGVPLRVLSWTVGYTTIRGQFNIGPASGQNFSARLTKESCRRGRWWEFATSVLVAQDDAQEAITNLQPVAARVINKARLPELVPETTIETRILSIVVFPAAFTRPRERSV